MDDLELIKQKINVVDFIQEYLPLKKAGMNFKANCPFHQEKSPSFVVSPERQIWHCFGCDRGGDIFKFLMEKEGIDFSEALDILAQKAGVTLSRQRNKSEKKTTDVLYDLNQKAAQFFHYILTEHPMGKSALAYLHNRGLTDETIKLFQIGYAPQSWENLTKFLRKKGFSIEDLINSGVAVQSKNGCYDRFRGRIMFPLLDVRNRIIGFSGRVLDGGEPKYINSPQTPIFDKSKFLFGIHLSKTDMKTKKSAILVEGEMDMLMSYQSGVKNIVASKGTALTESQIELLKRYTDNLSLCFDTDLAGDAASRRGIEIADRAGCNLKVVQIPSGKDPAELCLKDVSLWEKAVEEAMPIYDYYLDSVQKRFNLKSAADKKAIFNELLPIWQKIADPITKDHYIQKLAALLQVSDEVIIKQINRPMIATPPVQMNRETIQVVPKKEVETKDRRRKLEDYLISLLVHLPPTMTYVPKFPETLFTQDNLKQIYVMLVIYLDSIAFKTQAFKISDFSKTLPENLVEEMDRLYLMELDEKLASDKEWLKEVDMVVATLKKMLIKASLEKLSAQIKSAQSFDKAEDLATLNKRFRDLSLKLRNL